VKAKSPSGPAQSASPLIAALLRRPHAIAAERRPLDELEVVADEDHGARVAPDRDCRAGAHDGVDGAALPAELAKVGARHDGGRVREALGCGEALAHAHRTQ
jgi:hypothetical protein